MNPSHDLYQSVSIFRFRQKSGLTALYGKDRNGVLRSLLTNRVNLAHVLSARVSRGMYGRKVDVVVKAPNLMHLPIHTIALQEGVRL